ncbi:2Fe-2S iron-sulfur cluster-binding protein [Streptomyces rapamycinicus]|uniref:Phenylacetic acid degradation protein n=2 Tax=Streptomyces rapamycinicus TaxID=1226757 RepID=A0A0A0NHP3_STRRN|nr:2Fe-2S iron-sulfur cluster-binding protein [Streptomyces rapamycinicus]AGP56484.1 phenylacetic acid degradation protein [Streptomyces rapamycinicus NRRL 5491]MBB4784086.1 ring-1,2-phenylacetyl-CoA epoxidase subunit PaaE [Streptomyces rapamycinicus]RLV80429.1 phenylacetic acid degradation protein [Streptomyces rapamycinicus NRRL 5491]UTO64426.1 2Fe-2S iron-sulfur cluster binding domain-containing protein [Streptomyces rapamycinicus]UTP32382.1 2Fe-2S iron-sulfur cluster binding domain-contain
MAAEAVKRVTPRHGAFHPLRVAAVDRLTDDAVAVTLLVPPALRETFRFAAGQHIAVRRFADGAEIRRTYSICTPAPGAEGPEFLRIGVRLVEGGEFSTYALKELAVGAVMEVMAPAGRFVLEPRPGHFAAVVGGSGITPVLSIAATLLSRRPEARFCLIRSDRTAASTMFLDEVADLKDRWPDRFQLVCALSREEQQAGLVSGRLDEERLTGLLPALLPVASVDGWFLCGPYGLVRAAERALRGLGVSRGRVHQEIFHVDAAPAEDVPIPGAALAASHSSVTATLDGRSGTWPVQDGEPLLETVLRNRSDAPYACKGGVCGTCRAFLVSGEVRMDRNFALEPDELEAGYVLACQSHPVGERVELDFDR